MLIFDVRAKIWDFFNIRTQKWVRPKCHWNAILLLFEYINFVKFSKNLQHFLKRRYAPENPKTLQSTPRGPKSCNPTPLRGSKTPLYLMLGRQKGLGRGLVHPCLPVRCLLTTNPPPVAVIGGPTPPTPIWWGGVRGPFPPPMSTSATLPGEAPPVGWGRPAARNGKVHKPGREGPLPGRGGSCHPLSRIFFKEFQ